MAALISTSLLAYFVLSGRSQPYAQLQQEPGQQLAQQTPQQPTPQQAKPQPQAPVAPGPSVPSDDRIAMMIFSTLIALNQANATGNYTVLRDMGAPGFQTANSPTRIAEAFANLRQRNLDLSPILLFQPKLLRRPSINAQGMLHVSGFFPTRPERVNFDLLFQPVQGQWRLFGISADTSPAPAQATAPATPSPKPGTEASPPKATSEVPPKAPGGEQPSRLANPQGGATPAGKAESVDVRDKATFPHVDVGDDSVPPEPAPEAKPKDNSFNPLSPF